MRQVGAGSHSLKLLLDAVFGPQHYRSEIIWKRTTAHSDSRRWSPVVISVKGGQLKADDVRALEGVRSREKAEIGVLISFDEPTKKMRADAAALGVYDSPWGSYPRIQLLTVGELLEGRSIQFPHVTGGNQTFKSAPRHRVREALQLGLDTD